MNKKEILEATPDTIPLYGVALASLITDGMTDEENNASLDELARLSESLGHPEFLRFSQRRSSYRSPHLFGEGRVQEIAKKIAEVAKQGQIVTQIVFDREISPLQNRNLEESLKHELSLFGNAQEVTVTDRTGIIIEIFSRYAKTRQAKLQIEIARLKYASPRLNEVVEYHGELKGETMMELKRRELKDRVAQLRQELEALGTENESRREKRTSQTVGLLGYTNAGKSSVMRALTASEVYVADRLFATLDVTTRALQPQATPPILVTDTVGFVRFLPHELIASFNSSLLEANHSDLLLHVVDVSDSQFRIHMKTTDQVLKELIPDRPDQQLVFNKIDRLTAPEISVLKNEFPEAWWVSALSPKDMQELRSKIILYFESKQKRVKVHVPFDEAAGMGSIRKVATVLSEKYDERGTLLDLLLNPVDLDRLKSHFPKLSFVELGK